MERLKELVKTEQTFLEKLSLVTKVYQPYLKQSLTDSSLKPMPDGLQENEKYNLLFEHIPELIAFNEK